MSNIQRQMMRTNASQSSNASTSASTSAPVVASEPQLWRQYFDECQDVAIPNTQDVFRVYRNVVQDKSAPLLVLVHGAGHSALSWAVASKQIKLLSNNTCPILAYDCRDHGATQTSSVADMSLAQLSSDLVSIITTLYPNQVPDLFLVGHSMGGAVVVEVGSKRLLSTVLGVSVIDVVEGTAKEALPKMDLILAKRPISFENMQEAIRYHINNSIIRNDSSAAVSVPCMVKPADPTTADGALVWRTDLSSTKPFWEGWFDDMSNKFLSIRAARQLILAGTDRLDKTLLIGQMQGKFQLVLLPQSGHAIQEDDPMKVAEVLWEFWKRNQRLVLPPKVSSTWPPKNHATAPPGSHAPQ